MKKNHLDEMQELRLLRIEHIGCWLAFWGLAAVITVQELLGKTDFEILGGESLVFLVLCLYLGVSCIKNGIWDRWLKPNVRTNLALSLLGGVAAGAIQALGNYRLYQNPVGAGLTFACVAGFAFVLCFALLTVSAKLCRARRTHLDQGEQGEEDG